MKNKILLLTSTMLMAFGTIGYVGTFAFSNNTVVARAAGEPTLATTTDSITVGSDTYSCWKAGTSKAGGTIAIKVPAGSKFLKFSAASWNGTSNVSIDITPVENVASSSVVLTSNTGVAGNSPFEIYGDFDENLYTFTVGLSGIDSETTITLSSVASGKRFVIWDVSCPDEAPGTTSYAHSEFEKLSTETSLAVSYSSTHHDADEVVSNYGYSDFTGYGGSGSNGTGVSFSLNKDGFTFSSNGGYGSNDSLRIYSGKTFKIVSPYPMTKIVFGGTNSSYPVTNLSANKGSISSTGSNERTWTGSASDVTFTASGKQSRIMTLEITYGIPEHTDYSYSNVGLRFGIQYSKFPASIYNGLVEEAGESSLSFGVAVCKGSTWTEASAVTGSKAYVPSAKDNDDDGVADAYQYAMVLNGITNYGQIYVAKAYVKIGDTKYYAKATTPYSVNSIADSYVKNHASETLVAENKDMLADLSSATYKAAA